LRPRLGLVMLVVGLIVCITAALLMVATNIPSGYLTLLLIVGIGLPATSNAVRLRS